MSSLNTSDHRSTVPSEESDLEITTVPGNGLPRKASVSENSDLIDFSDANDRESLNTTDANNGSVKSGSAIVTSSVDELLFHIELDQENKPEARISVGGAGKSVGSDNHAMGIKIGAETASLKGIPESAVEDTIAVLKQILASGQDGMKTIDSVIMAQISAAAENWKTVRESQAATVYENPSDLTVNRATQTLIANPNQSHAGTNSEGLLNNNSNQPGHKSALKWRGPLTHLEIVELIHEDNIVELHMSAYGAVGLVKNEFTPIWLIQDRVPKPEEQMVQQAMVAYKLKLDADLEKATNDLGFFLSLLSKPADDKSSKQALELWELARSQREAAVRIEDAMRDHIQQHCAKIMERLGAGSE